MKNTSRRLPASREVEWGLRFATRVAEERNASRLESRDLIAGMYLSAAERLGRYWDEWEHLDDFLVSQDALQKPRFFYWFEIYNLMISEQLPEGLAIFDDEASRILARAEGLAFENASNEVRLEHFLAAVAESGDSGICQRFVASGMNVDLVRGRMKNREKPGESD